MPIKKNTVKEFDKWLVNQIDGWRVMKGIKDRELKSMVNQRIITFKLCLKEYRKIHKKKQK